VRNPFDGFQNDKTKNVVPATFWVNDIFAPSQLYPGSGGGNGNPWCDTSPWQWAGKTYSCQADPVTGDISPWKTIQMAYVIERNMYKLFHDFDNIQDGKAHGVFYATDANSADIRCAYFDEYNGYDCPGGWISLKGKKGWVADDSKKGAGTYKGAGCHFNHRDSIDQINAVVAGKNLVGSYECECEYAFRQDWGKWVDQLVDHHGKDATWIMDLAQCWMNNPTDMIKLQNQIYWKRQEWNNQLVPKADYSAKDAASNRNFWGWNEIPVDRTIVADRSNWDAVIIKLPAAACGGSGDNDSLSCMDSKYHDQLETQIPHWVKTGNLELGSTPVALVQEFMDEYQNFYRNFFCENWTGKDYKIVHDPSHTPQCYLAATNSNVVV
jgi:hypothetical protein